MTFTEQNPPPVSSEADYGEAQPRRDDADAVNGQWQDREDAIFGALDKWAEAEPADCGDTLCITLDEWAMRRLPARDYLLGSLFSTTTRAMLSADTGIGKTHLAMAWGLAMAAGRAFLHWSARRPAKVLYIDGEMPRELVKERLAEAAERAQARPDTFYTLCSEDSPSMPPLNFVEGQNWLDSFIAELGGIDFLILDNIMALTVDALLDPEGWDPMIPWMRSMTKRHIGTLLIHHTGHDSTRSYGTKTREWQLDTCILGEKVDDADADLSMKLRFTKARQRRPETRADYDPMLLRLHDNVWTGTAAEPERKPKQDDYALELLRRAIDEAGEAVPGQAANVRGVDASLWKRYAETYNLCSSDNLSSRERAWERARKRLLDKKLIRSKRGKVWVCQ